MKWPRVFRRAKRLAENAQELAFYLEAETEDNMFPGVDVWVTKPSEWSVLPPRFWDISTTLIGFSRLKPGIRLEQARAEMNVLNRQYAMADPGKYVARMQVAWLRDQVVANVRPTLWILFGGVSFVLLVGCANLAGLLLAGASSRSREFASVQRSRLFAVDTRGLLVVGQLALSMVLLIGATLLMKSFVRLESVDPGFQPANLLTAKIALPPARYDTGPKKVAFIDELVRRVEAIPGLRSAAVAMSLPTTSWLRTNIQIQGKPWEADPGNWPSVQLQSVTRGYFRTLGIPLERGREFTTGDNSFRSQPAVIINESFARRFWPAYPLGGNPIGQHLRQGADRAGWVEIIGIVAAVHEGGGATDTLPAFYVPCVIHPPQTANLVARTPGYPLHFASTRRAAQIDPMSALLVG